VFYQDGKLQYKVRVDSPNPLYAKMLQQAIGGVEGEIRVCMQYLFQAWGARGPKKYRDMLLNTGTEEIGHIEMLSTAVALNLEGSKPGVQEGVADKSPMIQAMLGGMSPRHYLSAGMAAMPVNSEGVPFDMSHIYASGNLAGDMYANVAAEATGRTLAVRLAELTDDPGMKDMWRFLIARDTMHQQQWLAVLEELEDPHNAPGDFENEGEFAEVAYAFLPHHVDEAPPADSRWTSGPSLDGKGEFHVSDPRHYSAPREELQPAPADAHRGPEGTLGDGNGKGSSPGLLSQIRETFKG
jgi:Mn-containing catalase